MPEMFSGPASRKARRQTSHKARGNDMAYMSQDHKARIAAELKKVVPKGWKYTLAGRHHSTIVMTIASAPVDLIAAQKRIDDHDRKRKYVQVNERHPEHNFDGALLEIFEKILAALNLDNHDRSDLMTDYFDVGHYVDLNIGRWNKPFVATAKPRLRFIDGEWKRAA